MSKRYYLDYNATTPLHPEVQAAMAPYLQGLCGNPSSWHNEGRRARGAIDLARDTIAHCLGVQPHEILFTAGGTESNNLAIQGLSHAFSSQGKHLVTSAGEHHAVLHTCQALCNRYGFELTLVPLQPNGQVDLEAVAKAIRDDTILVSLMSANNETGTRNPMKALGELCTQRGVCFHTDAIQSAGKEKIDLHSWQVSALSLTAHKCSGPVGAGLLYLQAGTPLARLMEGGSHENERRPGTENVAAIVGLARAMELAEKQSPQQQVKTFSLIEQLWNELKPLDNLRRNGDPIQRVSNTLNISFFGLDGEELLIGLDLAGLAVSSGSACLVGSIQKSHVLEAMGIPQDEVSATVRFSIGHDLEPRDITEIAKRVRDVVAYQRHTSNALLTPKAKAL